MRQVYKVIHLNNGMSGSLTKEFNSHEDALQYIEDMLKHHNVHFEIQKIYTQKQGEK